MASSPTTLAADAVRIWREGVSAADPLPLLKAVLLRDRETLQLGRRRLNLDEIDSIVVVGAGKAGARMSQAVESILGARLLRTKQVGGWVNVPDDAVRRLHAIHLHGARRGHENKPSRQGVLGTRRILALIENQAPRTLTLCLFSGGGSALLPAPTAGITLRDKERMTTRLHASGATIGEVNTVRKHLSTMKGGGLLRSWRGGWLTAFVLSDVVGDPLDTIASGPTSTDPTTYADAIEVLRRHGLWADTPPAVRSSLTEGVAGRLPETLKQMPPGAENILIGGNQDALEGASREARRLGYTVLDVSMALTGEASTAGRRLARIARDVRDRRSPIAPPACLLAGGETTVRLGRRPGRGGRCQELALAALMDCDADMRGFAFVCAGTDGEDGPTDAAGAIIDEALAARGRQAGLEPGRFLSRHDSYSFFDRLHGLIRTGPTGTNVMDLLVLLVE